jgi:hypothetical protein
MPSRLLHWSFALRLIVAVAALSVANCYLFPWQTTLEVMIEGGPVENAAIIAYYIALGTLWLFPPQVMNRVALAAGSMLLLACAARELDLHKSAFGMSILKSHFYRDYATGPQIAAALAILLPIFAAMGYLALRYGRRVIEGTRRGDPAAATVATMVILLFVLKAFDSIIGYVGAWLGEPGQIWGYTTKMGLITMALEETLEILPPLLAVIAIMQDRLTSKAK